MLLWQFCDIFLCFFVCHFTWLLNEIIYLFFGPCLSCSCSSTIQWRDWGQVWEVWTISNPTHSLPEWTGSNRRRALWDCGNQSCMLGDRLSWMNSFQTEHTFRYTVDTDNTFLHTSPILHRAIQSHVLVWFIFIIFLYGICQVAVLPSL